MAKEISDKALQAQLDTMPREMEPKRDLWPGIEKAIARSSQQSREPSRKAVMPMAWAASVAVAVFVSWLTLSPTGEQQKVHTDLAQLMTQEFAQQKQLMLTSFGHSKVSDLPQDMQKQLTELNGAQQAIIKALANDPTNSELLSLLRWTQKQELDLLKQLLSPQWQTI